jgi:tRNA pseudouridine38-40 synthase
VAAALDALSGEHDFHNLTPDDEGTVRELSTSVERDGEFLAVRLEAGGFARQLVRRIVGLASEIGRGESGLAKVDRVLDEGVVDGPEGVAPAAPYPLVLWDVVYPGVEFPVDADAAASAREVFGRRHAEFRTVARVAGSIRDSLE